MKADRHQYFLSSHRCSNLWPQKKVVINWDVLLWSTSACQWQKSLGSVKKPGLSNSKEQGLLKLVGPGSAYPGIPRQDFCPLYHWKCLTHFPCLARYLCKWGKSGFRGCVCKWGFPTCKHTLGTGYHEIPLQRISLGAPTSTELGEFP